LSYPSFYPLTGADGNLILGHYGLDTVNRKVWAVVNHGGQFAAINQTPADAWKASFFTPAQLADSTISGDNADPDGDGIANLMEYALGMDPTVPSQASLPATGVQTVSGQDYLAITFTRPLSARDVTYIVDVCAGLPAWNQGSS
jgi:hypothetical protein